MGGTHTIVFGRSLAEAMSKAINFIDGTKKLRMAVRECCIIQKVFEEKKLSTEELFEKKGRQMFDEEYILSYIFMPEDTNSTSRKATIDLVEKESKTETESKKWKFAICIEMHH
jgi:hypothetical protein